MSWRRWLTGQAEVDDARWVVLDVETSGLDTRLDRLLAVAAIAVRRDQGRPHICLGDSFEVVLRQSATEVDKDNILLHGIGVGAQHQGIEPRLALADLERWLGASPLIAFHAAFDEAMIQRAMQAVLARRLANPWLDLEHVAAVVEPGVPARSLDDWMAHFDIRCAQRHQAAADTLATAELLLRLWPEVCRQRDVARFRDLQKLAAKHKWLRR